MSPRIVSLLPSGTEIVCLAGAEQYLVGRSHECDYPQSITHLPILTAAANGEFTNSLDVHNRTCDAVATGKGLYSIYEDVLLGLKPTLIVTQSLCSVCSIDLVVVERVVARSKLEPKPVIINLNPQSLQDVIDDVIRVGEAAGTLDAARAAVKALEDRRDASLRLVKELGPAKLKNCCFLEWTEPLFCGGHWTPALIEWAGGTHPLNPPLPGQQSANPSTVTPPEAVTASDPDVIVICPCGLDLDMGRREAGMLAKQTWWRQLRAVKEGRVFLVDGNAHFNRPGPRLLDALDFLIAVLHERWEYIPSSFAWELLTLLPTDATDDAAAANTGAAAAGDDTGGQRPSVELGGPSDSDATECTGCHCAPNLPPDVEDAYRTAVKTNARSYKDPISGYQCFTELALHERARCCGNRCRHCPYGHFKVNTSRKGPRLNRITAPTYLSWGNSGITDPTTATLIPVACGQLPQATDTLIALTRENKHAVALVAVDPLSRAMWCSAGDSVCTVCTSKGQNGHTSVEPLSEVMDWCLKNKIAMVAVPVSTAEARRQGEKVVGWVVGEAVRVLGEPGGEERGLVRVERVAGVAGAAVPALPWLPAALNRAVAAVSWAQVSELCS